MKTIRKRIDVGPIDLPDKFKGEILRREGDVVLLVKSQKHRGNQFTFESYEVCIIQRAQKDRRFPNGDILLSGSERLPNSNEWGESGWSYSTKEAALAKYYTLVDLQIQREKAHPLVGVDVKGAF